MTGAQHEPDRVVGTRADSTHRAIEISVVIAARNAAGTLREQLDALASQRPEFGWEVLVCDNGSTDGTADLVRAMTSELPELRLVDASGARGPGAVRNVGAQVARGRDLVLCDADDVVGEGWLDAMHTALATHAFVAGRFEGRRLNDATRLRSRVLPQQEGLQWFAGAPELPHAGAGNMGIRAEVFHSVGGFPDPTICLEDVDLCWRIQLSGEPLVFVPEALLHVRLRSGLRGAARQGWEYGTGQRWIETRYRDMLVPEGAGDVAGGRVVTRRHRPRRVLGRALVVARSLAQVRSVGDLAALTWDLGWGLGHAFGRIPATEAVSPPAVPSRVMSAQAPTAAPSRSVPGAAVASPWVSRIADGGLTSLGEPVEHV